MSKNHHQLVVDLLVKGHAVIQDPKHWNQGSACRDEHGHAASTQSKEAYCFCSLGAIERAYLGHEGEPMNDSFWFFDKDHKVLNAAMGFLLDATGELCSYRSIAIFNDAHDHATVMRAWEMAIKTARSAAEASADWAEQEAESRG